MISKTDAVNWIKAKHSIDYDGKYGLQCVDFVRGYTKVLGAGQFPSLSSGGPERWATMGTPAGWTKITDANAGQSGDVFVFKPLSGNSAGHTGALISDVSGGHFTSVDQNWHPISSTVGSPPITVYHDTSRVLCYYRPSYTAVVTAAAHPTASQGAHVGDTLHLPPSVSSWRVYHEGGPYTANPDKSIGHLNPAKFGGINYTVLGNPAANIYTINTESFGRVAIYAGSDTPANFTVAQPEAAVQTQSVTANSAVIPQAVSVAATVPNNNYKKLDVSLDLMLKNDTLLFTLDDPVQPSTDLKAGERFTAYGQYTSPSGSIYYMQEADFGNADVTGVAASNVGVNTIDLTQYVAPPPDAWKATFKRNSAGSYDSESSVIVHDLDGKVGDIELPKDAIVEIGGDFEGPDGVEYYRTVKSTDGWLDKNGVSQPPNWRGIPKSVLDGTDTDSDIADIWRGSYKQREKAVAKITRQDGIKFIASIENFFAKLNIFKKQK